MYTQDESYKTSDMFPCSCGTEILAVDKFKDEHETYLSLWYRGDGRSRSLSWRDRFRYCWRILTQGSPYGDQLVLDPPTTARLAAFLTKLAESKEDIQIK